MLSLSSIYSPSKNYHEFRDRLDNHKLRYNETLRLFTDYEPEKDDGRALGLAPAGLGCCRCYRGALLVGERLRPRVAALEPAKASKSHGRRIIAVVDWLRRFARGSVDDGLGERV